MKSMITAALLCGAFAMIGLAVPAHAQSAKAQKADLSTCTGNRNYCAGGRRARGLDAAPCSAAYQACMQTGVWQTSGGAYARTRTGITRR